MTSRLPNFAATVTTAPIAHTRPALSLSGGLDALRRTRLRVDVGLVAGIVAVVAFLDTWWLMRYRNGGLIDLDEAGYLATSLEYSISGHAQGLSGLWHTFEGHAPSAPLVPFAASLIYDVFGTHFMLAFGVLIAAMVAVSICTAILAYRLGGSTAAVVATLAVAGTPVLIDYTRSFQFALPVTAFFTGAIVCMAASTQLRSRRFAIGWGILVGLMLLSRTMTLAFLPGLLLAGLLVAVTSPARSRALLNVALGVLAMVLVAGIWYAANWPAVIAYLSSNGYGAGTADYVAVPLSPSVLMNWINRQVNEYLYLPLAIVLLAGGVAFVGQLIAEFRGRRGTTFSRLRWLASRSRVVMAIPVVAGLAALMSSEQPGTGYIAPLLPVAVVLAVVSLSKVPWARVRVGALVLVALVGLGGVAAKSGLPPFVGGTVPAILPVYGYATFINPAGQIQMYEQAGGYGTGTLTPPETEGDWQAAERQAAQFVIRLTTQSGSPPFCAFGFDDRFFGPNQLWLESSDLGSPIPSTWSDLPPDSTAADAGQWLDAGAAKPATVLITAGSAGPSDIVPGADQKVVEEAAAASGFVPAYHLTLPNGRPLTFWLRSAPPA